MDIPLTTTERNRASLLCMQQFLTSLQKRALYSWRQKRLLFFQFLVLALSVGMGAVLNHILRRHQPQMPPLELNPAAYGPIAVPLTMSLSDENSTDPTTHPDALKHRIADQLVYTFRNSVFVGSTVQELPVRLFWQQL